MVFESLLKLVRPTDRSSPLWPISSRYNWTIPIVVLLSFVASALEGLGIGLLVPLIGILTSQDHSALPPPWSFLAALIGPRDSSDLLIAFGGLIFFSVLLTSVVKGARAIFISWIDGLVGNDIREALSASLHRKNYSFFIENDPARLINIVSDDAWRTSGDLRNRFNLVGALASSVVFSLMLLALNWKLAIVVIAGALLIRSTQMLAIRYVDALSAKVSEANTRLAERMILAVQFIRPIRVFSQQNLEHRTFVGASSEVRKAMSGIDYWSAITDAWLQVGYSALFIAILLGAFFGGVDLPLLATFMVLLYRLQPHLQQLSAARVTLAGAAGSVRQVEWLLSEQAGSNELVGGRRLALIEGPIVFRSVTYAYPASGRSSPVLSHASFEIAQGRTTALIGPSGSGKSTIVNLLCRLLDPVEGQILVGGIPLEEISIGDWRARIGLAGQDVELVDGSIRNNIAYGKPDATDAEIEDAAKMADIHVFVRGLPAGYDTEVGSRGLALSGGQRQRIGLARAFVRRPDLLILDEATNAVDGLSENAILASIKEHSWSATIIVVSHRASTLAFCDDGIVLENGRVVESGPMISLDAFRRMQAVQFH